MSVAEKLSKFDELAREYRCITSSLLERLLDLEDVLTEEILVSNQITNEKLLEKFDFKGYGFRFCGSNQGRYLHLVVLNDGIYKIIPPALKNIGRGFNYHGQYGYYFEYWDRKEILTFIKILPEFLENMINVLQDEITINKEKYIVLQKMLDNI